MAFNLANLAALEQRRGRPDEADPLYVTALPVLRRRLGAKHPFVATAMRNLALLRASQGRVPEARRLLARAERALRHALGDDHPDTRDCGRVRADLASRVMST